jgi:uncharacterized protein
MGHFEFDSHVHIFPAGRHKGLMRWIRRMMPDHPVPTMIDAKEIERDLLGLGVRTFFNMVYPLSAEETDPLNRWNLEFCRTNAMARPVCSLHRDSPGKPDIAADLFRRGSYGIKFHPFIQKFNPSGEEFRGLYRRMGEMGMPLFLHTGYDLWYGMEFTAEDIEKIIAENPGMPVVLAHMIFPHLERAFGLLERYENAWLDATNVPGSFVYAREKKIPVHPSLLDTFIAGMERHRDRIMYGSDYPVSMGSLESVHRDMLALELSGETMRAVTGETPARFCGIVDERRGEER